MNATSPKDSAKRADSVLRAAARKIDPRLRAALHAMNSALPQSPARDRNCEKLQHPGAVVLVTGQQMGLFLGPLFTAYKAISVIENAKALEAETNTPVVPLFWLQSEDHDVDEVNVCTLPAASGGIIKLGTKLDETIPARVSVSERMFLDDLPNVLHEALSVAHTDEERSALFRDHYRVGASFSSAFRGAMAQLFETDGLLFFDPRHPSLLPLVQPIYERAFADLDAIDELLLRRVQELRAEDLPEQVHVRAGSPLFFFRKGSGTGPRFRLSREGSAYTLIGDGEQLSGDEVLSLLRNEPERFSSTALLRPLIQDLLLPSAGYVGGPAEINYFRQIEPLYAHFGIEQPVVYPRGSFLLLEPKARRLLDQLGLPQDILRSDSRNLTKEILARSLPEDVQPAVLEARLNDGLMRVLEDAKTRAEAVDPRFSAAFDRSEEKLSRAVSGILDRYRKLVLDRDKITKERAEKLQVLVAPEGVPQERSYSFLPFWCKYGPALLEAVRSAFVPYNGETRIVELT
ncbi:MAG: bacillithiol biosynthesis cysteine-adding enzyme BshC [Bdellovibrionota bacterium]